MASCLLKVIWKYPEDKNLVKFKKVEGSNMSFPSKEIELCPGAKLGFSFLGFADLDFVIYSGEIRG